MWGVPQKNCSKRFVLKIKEQKNDERKGEGGSHVNNTGHTLLIIMSLFIGVYNVTSQITTS